jgi:hypothetical protein
MTLERSHGKLRPTLVRASDLEPSDTVAKPADARTPDGRFAAGNRTAVAARFTHTIRKALGSSESTGVALIVARDARRVFGSVLRSLPSEAPPVRALLAVYARHQALHGYYTQRAEALGLDSEAGLELLAVADRQSQRAERVLVTCHDLARVHCELDAKRIDENTVPVGFVDDDGPTVAPAPSDDPPETTDDADEGGAT